MHGPLPPTVASLLVFGATLGGCVSAPPPVSCTHRNADVEQAIGYCEAVRAGNELYISGITAAGPMESAVPKVYEALGEVLKSNGLSFHDVVKEGVYATDLDAFIANKDRRKEFYGGTTPAATWVQVQRLYRPAYVLEVELVARYPAAR